jgi:voltage-gated potassium channel
MHETDPGRFPNPWRGLWFAVVTVTTVGYGDTFPTSVVGRLVAAFLMVVGIGFLGLATASIAGHFVNRDAEEKHREATDKQDEILAELRRIHDRLDRLEAGS